MDLVSSLSVAELVKALRAGQIRDDQWKLRKPSLNIAEFDPALALRTPSGNCPARGLIAMERRIAIIEACVEGDSSWFLRTPKERSK